MPITITCPDCESRIRAPDSVEGRPVTCPKCGTAQTLKFENIKWPNCKLDDGSYDLDRIEREAFYQCDNAECQAPLNEVDKIVFYSND